ncbi:MAG: Na+/H+ antiporter NhaA, partial [Planctomycetota bacterium]
MNRLIPKPPIENGKRAKLEAPNTGNRVPLDRIAIPFQKFLHSQTTAGALLIVTAVVALIWANSPIGHTYGEFWHTKLTFGFGEHKITHDLHWWINEALMALFFLLVGLEIKRELLVGELSSLRKSALPIAAAIGGVVVPALIYISINIGKGTTHGWGIPMATDIAFALGVLALLKSGVPTSAKVFLTALAIIDDILASLVIAIFYTDQIDIASLICVVSIFVIMHSAGRIGLRHVAGYTFLGIALWIAMLYSGIHPTLSGIFCAFAIPAGVRIDARGFIRESRRLVDQFDDAGASGDNVLTNTNQRGTLAELDVVLHQAQTPLQQFEYALHPWVSLLIMPLFALANAGVQLNLDSTALMRPITMGVFFGLLLGKPIGIFGMSWLAVKLG